MIGLMNLFIARIETLVRPFVYAIYYVYSDWVKGQTIKTFVSF